MTIDEIMEEIHSFAENYFDLREEHVDRCVGEIKLIVEQAIKEEREKMRGECIAAVESVRTRDAAIEAIQKIK